MRKKMFDKMMILTLVLFLSGLTGMVQAGDIIYFDAKDDTVTIGGAAPQEGVNYTKGSSIGVGSDGLWHYRYKSMDLSANGYIWETDTGNSVDAETTDPLIVPVTLATPGFYQIYGLAELTNSMDCAFCIGSDGPYLIATSANSYYDGAYSVRNIPVLTTDGSNIAKYAGLFTIGLIETTTANEVIQVYVQGLDSGAGAVDQRTSFDGIAYELVLEPINPAPFDGEDNVDPDVVTYLSWYTTAADVTGHYLYINDDPNMSGVTPISVTDIVDPIEYSVSLETGRTYYWRVDESINYSGPTDSGTVEGDVWYFATVAEAPVIAVQPKDSSGLIGDTITFSVEVSSETPVHYAWFKSDDSVASVDDTSVGSDAANYQVTIGSSADEAYYYCEVSNDGTVPIGTEPPTCSNIVELGISRMLAHYKFEQNADDSEGTNNGTVTDFSGNPVTASYPAGLVDSYAIDLAGGNIVVELPTSAYPNAGLASGLRVGTITAWVKKSAAIGGGDVVMANYNDGGNTGFTLTVYNNSAYDARFNLRQEGGANVDIYGEMQDSGASMDDGDWHFVAAAYNVSGTCKLYIDGYPVGSETSNVVGEQLADWQYPILIGAGRSTDDRTVLAASVEANVDDVRIYNYAMNDTDIADIYLLGHPGEVICINPYGSFFDSNDDCMIDLIDFAGLAEGWLSCGLYPTSACGN